MILPKRQKDQKRHASFVMAVFGTIEKLNPAEVFSTEIECIGFR